MAARASCCAHRGAHRPRRRLRFSITVRSSPSIKAAIAGIPDEAWVASPYWSSAGVFGYHDDGTPVSGADVAEIPYTAFADTGDPVEVR
jgi:hypothetical protein